MRSLLPTLALVCLPLAGTALQMPTKSIEAVRLTEPLTIDGRLTESIWASTPAATGFTAQWPEFGQPSALSTEVRVLHDDHFLYVGARMRHPQGRKGVVRRVHRRDQWSPSDWFGVCIDSLRDRSSAWVFSVNAAGVQRDAVIFGDTNWDYSWDGVWESAVALDADGWTAEFKIPLSLLRMHASTGPQSWGINFLRDAQGPIRESSVWELTPRGINAFVSRFPELTGLDNLQPQQRREWIPFISLQRKFETANAFDDRGWKARAGLDAHLSLNTFSQLDFTARPDFGQVEVDQATLNLSTYETYLQEKRPFFLEGMDIFQVAGPQLLYSRRIGAGLGDPDLNEGEILLDRPQSTEIAGAAKYTGKFQNGLNLGVLGANVETARAVIQRPDGSEERRIISPSTTFSAARAKEVLDDRGSYVGGFLSYMDQSGHENREALVGALDSVYKSEDRGTVVDATLSRSQAGPKEGQDNGHRERFGLNRRWTNGWWAGLGGANATRNYNPNDMGFLGRADEQRLETSLGRSWDLTWNSLRNWGWSLGGSMARDQEGKVFQRSLWSSASTGFTNFCGLRMSAGADLPADSDRELRTFGDPVKKYLHYGTIPYMGLGVNSPDNRPWFVQVNLDREWREGGPSTSVNFFQSIKMNSSVELQLGTGTTQTEGELSYLETQGTTPVVGLRRLSQFNQTLRLAYAVSPNLTFQVFSQWLESNWNYRNLKSYVDDDTLAAGASSGQTAFSNRIWSANLITRWEFHPGSTFFLVYTHGASTDSVINDRASVSPWQDLPALNHQPSDDALQVKLSYLFR